MVKPSEESILVYEGIGGLGLSIAGQLAERGYHVTRASDRSKAVALIREQQHDLVLIAGDMNAEEARVVTAVVKALNRDMLVTLASTHQLEPEELLGTGVDLYIHLPTDQEQLLQKLAGLLDSPWRLK